MKKLAMILFVLLLSIMLSACFLMERCEHDWTAADCENPKTCALCGKTEGYALGHTPEEDDGDCTTVVLCTVCGEEETTAKPYHTPSTDDGNCTTAVTCSFCPTVVVPAYGQHIAMEDDGNCTTPVLCQHCPAIMVVAQQCHRPGEVDDDCTTPILCKFCPTIVTFGRDHLVHRDDGDCTTAVGCYNCGQTIVVAKEHDFTGEWTVTGTEHWHICANDGCKVTYDKAAHSAPGDCIADKVCVVCNQTYGKVGHRKFYTVDGLTINATCSRGCGYTGSVTLGAPENLIYDGQRKEAVITVIGDLLIEKDYCVSYNAPPINPGEYTAYLSADNVEVEITFVIVEE